MKKGFTLVELLVAISIIAVLSTIGLASFSGTQSKARDSVRKSDLRTLATTLEIYYQQKGTYLISSGSCIDGTATSTIYTNADFVKLISGDVPKDPKTNEPYCYEAVTGGLNYTLYAKLENCPTQGTIPGIDCQTSKYNYLIQSEDFIAQATPTPTSTAVLFSTPLPISTPTPTPIPVPPPLPTPPSGLGGDCEEPVTTTISVKAFLADPADNPAYGSIYPSCFGVGCTYNHVPLQNVIVRAKPTSFSCFAAETYGVTDSSGVANIDVYGRWEYDPGDGTQILETIPYEIWAERPGGHPFYKGMCYQKRYRGGSLCDIVDVQTTGKGAQCDEDQAIEKGCLLNTNFGFTR